MSRKESGDMERARKYYLSRPEGKKPSADVLAEKFDLNRATIYRAEWFNKRPYQRKEAPND